MLRGGDVKELQELKRQGLSISQLSAITGFDRKTIRKYLADTTEALPRYGPRPSKGSKLEPFEPYLAQRLSAGVWNAVVLLAELKARGYTGEYTVLKDYLRPLRTQARAVAVRRFETPPGHQAQVDWGELGHLETAKGRQRLYGFVFCMALSSRSGTAAPCLPTSRQTPGPPRCCRCRRRPLSSWAECPARYSMTG